MLRVRIRMKQFAVTVILNPREMNLINLMSYKVMETQLCDRDGVNLRCEGLCGLLCCVIYILVCEMTGDKQIIYSK